MRFAAISLLTLGVVLAGSGASHARTWYVTDDGMGDAPTIVGEDHETVQKPEGRCGDGEEIASRRLGQMVPQEGAPALGRRSVLASGHVLGHGGLAQF